MKILDRLVSDVAGARRRFLDELAGASPVQAAFRPGPSSWSMVDITEHMVRAEDAGVHGIWRALESHRRGETLWSGEAEHRGLTIEEVTARTWREKEEVPDVAAPRDGGSLSFWAATLRSRHGVLEALAEQLAEDLGDGRLEELIYPHPISGPLDVRQRLEFLRFHLDRHRRQVAELKAHADFPGD